jgi:hypothetical protein
MSISRRKFLHTGTLAVVAAGIPMRAFAAAASKPSQSASLTTAGHDQASPLNKESFARHLNTTFELRHRDHSPITVKLIELKDWHNKGGRIGAKTECFSAIFVSSNVARLPQSTYAVHHPQMGKFDLLLVPNGQNKQGEYYEAIFNRLV